MKINHALIMAAGRGMRMMPLTQDIPKAMAPYDGSTLIARGIEEIKKFIPNVHITVGYKGAMLAAHVIEYNVNSIFNTEGRDNAWWIFNTLMKTINEPVIVLTCDNVIRLNIDLIEKEYYDFGAPACMVVPVKPIPGLDGDYIFHNKNVVSELSRTKKTSMYCSGIQVLNPGKTNSLINKVDNFYYVWQQLIEANQLYCSNIYPDQWYAVDTIEQLTNLNNSNNK